MATALTTEQAIFAHAARRLEYNLYGVRTPAAKAAWAQDRQFFIDNATAVVRIRRVHLGECGVAWLSEGAKVTVWAIILHHIRPGDLRFSHGIGVWLFKSEEDNSEALAAVLRIEARRLMGQARLPVGLIGQPDDQNEEDEDQALLLDAGGDI